MGIFSTKDGQDAFYGAIKFNILQCAFCEVYEKLMYGGSFIDKCYATVASYFNITNKPGSEDDYVYTRYAFKAILYVGFIAVVALKAGWNKDTKVEELDQLSTNKKFIGALVENPGDIGYFL